MALLKSIYLTDRVFYALGTCVCLFFVSFLFAFVFYIALAFLFCIIIFISVDIYILFNAKAISVDRKMPAVFSLGDKNKIALTITNNLFRKLNLKIIDEIPYQFNQRNFSVQTYLAKSKTELIYYTVSPLLRGEYLFGDIHVFVKTEIGFISKKETTFNEKPVAVYPSITQMNRLELSSINRSSFLHGENKNRKLGQSYEFDEIKLYVPGDDARNINWKASSTLNEIMVNCYEDERSQQIYSIIDKSRVMKMPFNGLTLVDYAVNSSLAFSNIVLKKQDKAGLLVFSDTVSTTLKADKGSRHLKKIIYALYKEKYDYSEANYEGLYSVIRRTIPNRSLLFLYTNFDSIYALERNMLVLRLINKYHLLVVVFFENTELDTYSKTDANNALDIYQLTIAKKFILEKTQIYKELKKQGIHAIKCTPETLSNNAINKYLELKTQGFI